MAAKSRGLSSKVLRDFHPYFRHDVHPVYSFLFFHYRDSCHHPIVHIRIGGRPFAQINARAFSRLALIFRAVNPDTLPGNIPGVLFDECPVKRVSVSVVGGIFT